MPYPGTLFARTHLPGHLYQKLCRGGCLQGGRELLCRAVSPLPLRMRRLKGPLNTVTSVAPSHESLSGAQTACFSHRNRRLLDFINSKMSCISCAIILWLLRKGNKNCQLNMHNAFLPLQTFILCFLKEHFQTYAKFYSLVCVCKKEYRTEGYWLCFSKTFSHLEANSSHRSFISTLTHSWSWFSTQ